MGNLNLKKETFKGCEIQYSDQITLLEAKRTLENLQNEGFLIFSVWSVPKGIIAEYEETNKDGEICHMFVGLMAFDNGEINDCTFDEALKFVESNTMQLESTD